MRYFLLLLLLAITSTTRAEDHLRSGTPKDCYLYSFGKGPNWIAKVSTEFQLPLLNRQMPYVDEQFSEPTEKALTWIERTIEPTTTTIATVEGRKIIQITYPEKGSFGKTIGVILFAIETARDSEWFSPFFAAQPELFSSQFVSGKDVPFGLVATLQWSGTGAFRSHHLFDLKKLHPIIVASLHAGRVVRNEFDTDQEYQDALKNFDRESDLLSGIIPPTNSR